MSAAAATKLREIVLAYITSRSGVPLIRRRGSSYWELPGGGVEPGEEYPHAIAREVQGEVGGDLEEAQYEEILVVPSDRLLVHLFRTPHIVSLDKIVFRGDDGDSVRLFGEDEIQRIPLRKEHRQLLVDAGIIRKRR